MKYFQCRQGDISSTVWKLHPVYHVQFWPLFKTEKLIWSKSKGGPIERSSHEVYSPQDETERAWPVWPSKAIAESGYRLGLFLSMNGIIVKKGYWAKNQCYHMLYKLYDHKLPMKTKVEYEISNQTLETLSWSKKWRKPKQFGRWSS